MLETTHGDDPPMKRPVSISHTLLAASLALACVTATSPSTSVAQEKKVIQPKGPTPKGGACAWDNPPYIEEGEREADVGQELVITAVRNSSAGACPPQNASPSEVECVQDGCDARIERGKIIVTSLRPGNMLVNVTFYKGLKASSDDDTRDLVGVRFLDEAMRAVDTRIQASTLSEAAKNSLKSVGFNLTSEHVDILLAKSELLSNSELDAFTTDIEFHISASNADAFFQELATISDDDFKKRVQDNTMVPDSLSLDGLDLD